MKKDLILFKCKSKQKNTEESVLLPDQDVPNFDLTQPALFPGSATILRQRLCQL
jgi:hypothetical protein